MANNNLESSIQSIVASASQQMAREIAAAVPDSGPSRRSCIWAAVIVDIYEGQIDGRHDRMRQVCRGSGARSNIEPELPPRRAVAIPYGPSQLGLERGTVGWSSLW